MTKLYLSRARLRTARGEALASLAPVLLSAERGRAASLGHRIVWMLFQKTPDAGRAQDWRNDPTGDGFLWRDDGDGRYLVLSRKPPTNPNDLFDLDRPKEFAPEFDEGDELSFVLRANPVVASKCDAALNDKDRARKAAGARLRGKKVDVVMHALRNVAKTTWDDDGRATDGRALERDRLTQTAVTGWLEAQGAAYGFRLVEAPVASNYVQVPVERAKGRPAGVSMVDVSGRLAITDPAKFLAKLPLGFGSAKAFGCGLMLIRRA